MVYVGTNCGLAASRDMGKTWFFLRGVDWKAKAEGRFNGFTPADMNPSTTYLTEDYVSSIAEDENGCLWIGHRQAGLEIIDPNNGGRGIAQNVTKGETASKDFINVLSPFIGHDLLVGTYGRGVIQLSYKSGSGTSLLLHRPEIPMNSEKPPFPPDPQAMSSIWSLLGRSTEANVTSTMLSSTVLYLGQDWLTQGNWNNNYGSKYALLCAADAPRDVVVVTDKAFRVSGQLGPHSNSDDALRRWIHWAKTDNPKSLYDPLVGYRRQSEWDDHGEAYDQMKQGPDIWITVTVPRGVHRVSLYFINKDGHTEANRYRDYLIRVKAAGLTVLETEQAQTLAQARVHNFWGGVYHQFAVRGPGQYEFIIERNNSFNTICSGVFLDDFPSH